jgi:Fe-S-cluster containining protein
VEYYRSRGVETVKFGRFHYIKKTSERCPFLNSKGIGCNIYEERPIACRIYPLDIISHENGRYSWTRSYTKAKCIENRPADISALNINTYMILRRLTQLFKRYYKFMAVRNRLEEAMDIFRNDHLKYDILSEFHDSEAKEVSAWKWTAAVGRPSTSS